MKTTLTGEEARNMLANSGIDYRFGAVPFFLPIPQKMPTAAEVAKLIYTGGHQTVPSIPKAKFFRQKGNFKGKNVTGIFCDAYSEADPVETW